MRPCTRIATLAAIAGAGVLGTTSQALASDFQLTLSGPPTTNVGQPTVFHVDGMNPPPAVYPFESWLDIAVIPTSVTPTCPQDDSQATTLAPGAGGGDMVMNLPEHVDVNGHFTAIAGFTPIGPGTGLICAYTKDDSGNTLAAASTTLEIRTAAPASVPPPGLTPTPLPASVPAPTNLARPRLIRTRSAVSCSPGRWSGAVSRYTYRWLVGGQVKIGASSNRLRLNRALRGRVLKCAVTATGPSGKSATATSAGLRG